ncbi:MAG: MATE family efflux transporter [Lachnospiraceae bacterium]|nr:MATE family efflux transporter [Lachnospiraceae bacterium]
MVIMSEKNKAYALFSDRDFWKKLVKITLPIAFQYLMLASVAASDALMLVNVEQNAMSAVSLATQVQFVQNMFISSIATAGSILGAQYWGKKDNETVGKIFSLLIRFNVVISALFFVGCIVFPRELMLIFTNEESLISIGIQYLRIAGWSYLLTGISQCYLTVMKVSDHVAQTAVISSSAVIINIFLNAVFIYGLFKIPAMSVEGAAIATLIARIYELIVCVLVSLKKGYIRLKLTQLFAKMGVLTKDFIKCMWPLLGAYLFWGVGFTSYTAFMGHLGEDAAAANSITAVIRDLVCCVCDGLAGGAGIIVGNALGAGKLEDGKRYGIKIAKLAFIIGIGSALVMYILTPVIINTVDVTEQAREYLLQMMLVMGFYMIGRCVNTIVINGVFSAGGDTLFDMYSLAICMWGIAVPLAALGTFVLDWPVFVVYACTCLDEVGKIPWVMYHFRKYRWVKDLTR